MRSNMRASCREPHVPPSYMLVSGTGRFVPGGYLLRRFRYAVPTFTKPLTPMQGPECFVDASCPDWA
eukprot:8645-Eustigmatos_ZCMA.PRE.1